MSATRIGVGDTTGRYYVLVGEDLLGELPGLLEGAAQVIETRDLALAAQVETQDDELDQLMLDISREISRSEEATYTGAQVIALTLLIRFYERIGDHAVSLVRRIGFLVTGDSLDTLSAGVDVQEF